jgi:hypothetical protein
MRPPEVTNEEILAAGKEIQSQGKKVTGWGIRSVLGRGNANRFKTIWDEFSNQNKQDETDLRLPVELEDLVSELEQNVVSQIRPLTVKLYEGALKAAQKQVSETSRELKQTKEDAEAEMQEADAIIQGLEKRLETNELELKMTKEKLKESEEERQKWERNSIVLGVEVKELRKASKFEASFEEMMKRLEALENNKEKG